MKKITIMLLILTIASNVSFASGGKDFYQIKIYHLKNAEQEKKVDAFLEKAYLPALHRAGITKAGVFKPADATDSAERLIYVFIPYHGPEDFLQLERTLEKDKKYNLDGAAYLDAPYNEVPYERIETILLNAFEGSPRFKASAVATPKAARIYELRSYEGPTENLFKNKVKMFNTGDEIGLFKRLGFNAVFYAEVLSGTRMPNLMYLTTFENKADREKHWDTFGKDEYWKKLSAMPEYKNNVSKQTILFLHPTAYSDL